MRQWTPSCTSSPVQVLQGLIGLMGQREFETSLLGHVQPLVPAASYSIYQTGSGCDPTRFMSSSLGIPDTTRECWNAYLSGPYRSDRTLAVQDTAPDGMVLCHITAPEVPAPHRTRVYEAHGMAERVSIVQRQNAAIFAINFYRHDHQRPFSDGQLSDFEALAPALLSLAQKQIELTRPRLGKRSPSDWVQPLQSLAPALTERERDVCARLLSGMTQEGIARDLGVSLPTVKTYRNRAFARLGIHFKSELFALFAG
ncbi:helix-turn-helix transcriptional regulator [Limnohabitans lacus]|jgi:DNA-binding CsgD family transcriptional regulator|uniref:Helix-turn-helix transcriptional regulator n=1 Tax=Limnohabitans lacus TaxID=3045173 RepID=A0ABT6X313_9BURK|nr:helix-turn-helix transcriptional regulator [Limnohabitans sp. HM2-2]MDI9232500.1 helix-turn-helix transcriptional regulator [Limnohabitans sp. HM2-2]